MEHSRDRVYTRVCRTIIPAQRARQCRRLHLGIGAFNQAECEYVNLIIANGKGREGGEFQERARYYFIRWWGKSLMRVSRETHKLVAGFRENLEPNSLSMKIE